MRLINWNIERRGPHQWQAASILSEVLSREPDLIFLTEAHEDSLDGHGWHTLAHQGYRWENKKDSERLVLLGSRAPWEPLALPSDLQRKGGAVLGRTTVNGTVVTCFCLCIPYHMAKLPGETVTRPWAHHISFLEYLTPWLAELRNKIDTPLIVAGDFNRQMPSNWGSRIAYEALERCFDGFRFATRGTLAPLEEKTIDHVAYSGRLVHEHVTILDRHSDDLRPRSDHHGIEVGFTLVQE